jgi:hypothetical protein
VGIGHHLPLRGLVGPACAVGSVGVAAVGAVDALVGQSVAVVDPSDNDPGAGGWLAGVAFAVQLDPTTLAPTVAYSSSRRIHWYSSAGDRGRAGRAPGLRAANTGSSVGVAGWPARWRAAAAARWRTASGVAGRHAEAVAGEGLAQRRPGGA